MTFLTILLTACLSGLTAALCTFYMNESKERWELKRSKIEKIFTDSETFQMISLAYVHHHSLLDGSLTRSQITELTSPPGGEETGKRKIDRIYMNVCLYFPELREKYDAVISERNKTSAHCANMERQEYRRARDSETLHRELDERIDSFVVATKAFEQAIIEVGRQIAEEPSQASKLFALRRFNA